MSSFPPFQSHIHDIMMPALFDREAAQLLATFYQLEQSQWWSPEQILQAQGHQLACLINHARQHAPYYRERLSPLQLSDDPAELMAQWQQIPILTRKDITDAGTNLFTTAPLDGHGRQRDISTSGSTGKPLKARSNQLVDHFYRAITLREQTWSRRDYTLKLAAIRPDKKPTMTGTNSKFWGKPIQYFFHSGTSCLLHSSVAISKQVDWLLEQNPAYLVSMPSNLVGLAEEFNKRGTSLPSLKQLISYAETLKPETRTLLKNVFDVDIVDMYSSVEVGYIGLQCPEQEHLHIQSEVVLSEVLDDNNQPCAPGSIGRLVVTPLHNFSSPLIRYENGDYVEVGSACPCGRGLPVIKRVLGRERNLITLPNGNRHWPTLKIDEWAKIVPILQAQVVQKTLTDLNIRLVSERPLTPDEEMVLADFISKKLHYKFNYQFSYHDNLERGRNRKFEDFISELKS